MQVWGTWRYGLEWTKATSFGAFLLLPWFCLGLFALWYWVARVRECAVDRWGSKGVLPPAGVGNKSLGWVLAATST
jgi:hypothetical protein